MDIVCILHELFNLRILLSKVRKFSRYFSYFHVSQMAHAIWKFLSARLSRALVFGLKAISLALQISRNFAEKLSAKLQILLHKKEKKKKKKKKRNSVK